MANDLSTQQTGKLVQTIDQQGVGDLLKPLIREIHLFDSYVAGTTHLEDQSVLEKIEVGDRLSLRREENKFDENAILILTEARVHTGERQYNLCTPDGCRENAYGKDQYN